MVCHKHFTEEDYVTTSAIGENCKNKILKSGAVPSQFRWTKTSSPAVIVRCDRAKQKERSNNFSPAIFLHQSIDACDLGAEVEVSKPKVEYQFLLVLMKLRQRKCNYELALMFGIEEKAVYNIFVTWVRFMALQWREIDLWPSKDLVHFYSPEDFFDKFPDTRVVLDGTECPVNKPKQPVTQQATFSKYKNRNTVKKVVGSTPGGLVSHVSPAYGGSVSDRHIIERSDIPKMCNPGDSIMADKGFEVQDLFAPHDVTVNIPTFFKTTNRLSGKAVLSDRKIASKRVHIERIIGLGKTYKILTSPLGHAETQLTSDIIFICFMLCNFHSCIVPSTS
ncbi:hypothetical protein Pmani_002171 [Petrolisthes manimaculis]|uniref:Transposase n=1 Tax=Petrolisthes manimaculis TaxID=1843537 RepID=A0AAE1QI29_9EUCA|nr:hypothetical protein Pmani_002171 [Petrolisthes manimaculis]